MIESVTDALSLVLFLALVFLDGIHTKAKAKARRDQVLVIEEVLKNFCASYIFWETTLPYHRFRFW